MIILNSLLILLWLPKFNHSFLPVPQNPTKFFNNEWKEQLSKATENVFVNGFKITKNFKSSSGLPPTTTNEVTPYQILYPYVSSNHKAGDDVASPLQIVMNTMEKALKRMTEIDMNVVLDGHREPSKVLRIEHMITDSVDPLSWLHYQQQTTSVSKNEVSMYFSNAQRTMEAAAVGAAYLHQSKSDAKFWNFIRSELPPSSHVYGGERFDPEMMPSEEWKAFGSGYWFLPTVEVRKQNGKTKFAVHVVRESEEQSWSDAAKDALDVLTKLSDHVSKVDPTTTLPSVISRDSTYGSGLDAQDVYKHGVTSALEEFSDPTSSLQKVVLARRSCLRFDKSAKLSALDILREWKFGGKNEGGHLFFLRPKDGDGKEFFGCTPEQLFSVSDKKVTTEALAGTRPRGSTEENDEALSQELFESSKDRSENEITGNFISSQLEEAVDSGLLVNDNCVKPGKDVSEDRYFVRKLKTLQHICQRFQYNLEDSTRGSDAAEFLLHRLHPTPAVCGFPGDKAMKFIRDKESVAFDRGFYAGPFGYVGGSEAEITVALRCGLVDTQQQMNTGASASKVFVFAGAGLVPGSTVQGEWEETFHKLNVISALFPKAPISTDIPYESRATGLMKDLIRCGPSQLPVLEHQKRDIKLSVMHVLKCFFSV